MRILAFALAVLNLILAVWLWVLCAVFVPEAVWVTWCFSLPAVPPAIPPAMDFVGFLAQHEPTLVAVIFLAFVLTAWANVLPTRPWIALLCLDAIGALGFGLGILTVQWAGQMVIAPQYQIAGLAPPGPLALYSLPDLLQPNYSLRLDARTDATSPVHVDKMGTSGALLLVLTNLGSEPYEIQPLRTVVYVPYDASVSTGPPASTNGPPAALTCEVADPKLNISLAPGSSFAFPTRVTGTAKPGLYQIAIVLYGMVNSDMLVTPKADAWVDVR